MDERICERCGFAIGRETVEETPEGVFHSYDEGCCQAMFDGVPTLRAENASLAKRLEEAERDAERLKEQHRMDVVKYNSRVRADEAENVAIKMDFVWLLERLSRDALLAVFGRRIERGNIDEARQAIDAQIAAEKP